MAYNRIKTTAKRDWGFTDGPALHVMTSLAAALVCTTCSMPLDVVLTVYQSAHSLGGERLQRYGMKGPLGCAATLLRAPWSSCEAGPLHSCGWHPHVLQASTCTSSCAGLSELHGFLD